MADNASIIKELMKDSEARIRNAFLLAIKEARSDFDLEELAKLLQDGRWLEALTFAEKITTTLSAQVSLSVVSSGDATAALISNVLFRPVSFDQTNVRAVRIMQDAKLRLIREFTEQQRLATREALFEGIRRQVNPIEQARYFRDSVGLTQHQQRIVNNFRRLLESQSSDALNRKLRDARFDRTVRRSIDSGEPLTTDQVNKMVERYRERFIKYRSEMIARTESLRAVHQGAEEMYQQAFDSGELKQDEIVRTWNSVGDGRTRHHHATMNGQKRKVGEKFRSGQGTILDYPGDPKAPGDETIHCRCLLVTRFAEV
jgi:hypothetical protein